MGCWYGCGHCRAWPSPHGWYGPPMAEPDWPEETAWPVRPRYRRRQPIDPERAAAALEARLEELRDELRQVEAALAEMRRAEGGSRST